MSKVIVTGAAGFIGGETVLKLLDSQHKVLGIDRVVPSQTLLDSGAIWYTGDFSTESGLDCIRTFGPDAIVHCAGTSLVGPSITNPEEYYDNNFVKTKRLLDYLVCNHNKPVRFIFSSSAATYGNPVRTPLQEVDPAMPISPYGESKLMVELMLNSYRRAYGVDSVIFRYFNACGADSTGRHGQLPGGTHIIARVLEAVKNQKDFVLYGDQYPTVDGTCIRDYIHVEDLASAHILAIDLVVDVASGTYNLGTNLGHSNLEIIQMASYITKHQVSVVLGPLREGDPATLTADAGKFMLASGWRSKFTLKDMVQHAWTWYNQ